MTHKEVDVIKMIEVVELTKRFGDLEALGGISFEVGEGEIFGLLGRNGSGKTTTIRILTGLDTATSGRVEVGGFDLATQASVAQRLMGVTLQEAAIDVSLTGREFLELVGRLWSLGAKGARARTSELLELFGLGDAADRRIGTYSGGMQRRLDIAASLVVPPRVLFLDEPTTGLDPQSRRGLWTQIEDLRSEGTTVFLTTQYLEEAEALADRIAIMDSGRIIDIDSPSSLRARHGATSLIVSPCSTEHTEIAELARSRGFDQELVDAALRISFSGSLEALDFASELADRFNELCDIEIRQDSLEDIFLKLTGDGVMASQS